MNNLLLRRRALMRMGGKEKSLLPDGYTQLEYVTRSQAFSTEDKFILPRLPMHFELKVEINFPYYEQYNESTYWNLVGINSSFQVGYTKKGYAHDGNRVIQTVFYHENIPAVVSGTFASNADDSRYYVDGVDTGLRRATTNMNSFFLNMAGKIFYLRVFDTNGDAFYYLPCERNADGAKGLYDVINNVFVTASYYS